MLPTCGDPTHDTAVVAESDAAASADPVGLPAVPDEVALTDSVANDPEPDEPAADEAAAVEAGGLPDLTGWYVSEGHLGLHTLAWRPIGHAGVPRNVEFSADVLLMRAGQLVTGAFLQVTGYMPAHGHGMVQLPQAVELGEGSYRVDGMLLHMRGSWQVRFSVVADRTVETVSYEFEL